MAAANDRQQAPLTQFGWQKGQSGNPGGTSKKVREVRDMLAKLHPDCEAALRGMIAGWQDDRRAAVAAIQIVYARSIGKERESVFTPKDRAGAVGALDAVDVKKLPDAALDELDAVLKRYAT
jgi:hypothetical protein